MDNDREVEQEKEGGRERGMRDREDMRVLPEAQTSPASLAEHTEHCVCPQPVISTWDIGHRGFPQASGIPKVLVHLHWQPLVGFTSCVCLWSVRIASNIL